MLETLDIGQAIYLNPREIVRIVCSRNPMLRSLSQVRLVDVCSESIWGPRMRMSNLESASAGGVSNGIDLEYNFSPVLEERLERIHRVVRWETMAERIIEGVRY